MACPSAQKKFYATISYALAIVYKAIKFGVVMYHDHTKNFRWSNPPPTQRGRAMDPKFLNHPTPTKKPLNPELQNFTS